MTDEYYQLRARLLRPLSMTCRAMRLRLVPWIWEHLEIPPPYDWSLGGEIFAGQFNVIAKVLNAHPLPAASVKCFLVHLRPCTGADLYPLRFMTVDLAWSRSSFPPLVKCLQSLPNLHTLKIGRVDNANMTPLKKALKGVKLPQIKTLIIPPTAHPLVRHCCAVEDVVCAVWDQNASPDRFIKSLVSNRNSRVKRLAVPLVMWNDPSRKRFSTLRDHEGIR